MARSSWSYLKGERRIGEYEELTLRSVGHWWMRNDEQWPDALRQSFHVRSETGVEMVEPTRLHLADPGVFRDPFKLTYRSYTLQQDAEEKKLDGLIEGARAGGGLAAGPGLADVTDRYIPGMRHAFWGFGMLQTYGAAYTPAGTVMNALLFQSFDCMRHAQRFVELSWALGEGRASGDDPWLGWAPLQPLRRFVELALANFDWGENLVLLNAVLLPLWLPVHRAVMVDLPQASGNWFIPQFWLRLEEDSKRHLQQAEHFVGAALRHDARNRRVVQDWIDTWQPLAIDAIDALAPVFGEPRSSLFANLRERTVADHTRTLATWGVVPAPAHGGEHATVGIQQ